MNGTPAGIGLLPAPQPVITPATAPYWQAARDGVLLLRSCTACSTYVWYPRAICPECGSDEGDWVPSSGRGTLYSFTEVHRGEGVYASQVPYVLAYVELAEGPRIVTNLLGLFPYGIEIGMPVRAVFESTGESAALVRFVADGPACA